MNTKEIIKNLHTSQMIKNVVPSWAHCSVPFPFYRNGIACLGFYFYPMRNIDGKHLIQSPITQVIITYPAGHIVGITASPFFLKDANDSKKTIGEYPPTALKSLSVAEGNVLYDKYYSACDAFFESGNKDNWKECFDKVKEEGMEHFFSLLLQDASIKKVVPPAECKAAEKAKTVQEKPIPISAKVRHSLRDIQNFLKNPTFSKEAAEVSRLINNYARSAYEIAVIGEFSRGKTTFLNNLLGTDCLPIGNLPTTAVLTKVRNSQSASAVFIDKSRKKTEVELSCNALENFLADDEGNDPQGVLDLSMPLNWLDKKNIVFYDTPGVGDVVSKRADIARKAINHCDCTIMAISAQAGCSMTEMEFLHANVILKAVPKCIILITKLDTIPENERMKVVSYIKTKISEVLPTAQYWVAQEMPGVDRNELDACGIDAIRSAIVAQCSSDEVAAKLRERQLVTRVQMVLLEAKNEVKIIEAAEKLSDEEKCAAIKKLEYHKEHLELLRQQLELKCDSLCHNAEQDVFKYLDEASEELLTDLQMSLDKTNSPKNWCEKDYPYMVRKRFKAISNSIEMKVVNSIMKSRNVLCEIVKQQLSNSGITVSFPEYESINGDSTLNFTPDDIIDKTKNITCCVKMATTVGSLLLSVPFGIGCVVSGAVNFITERVLKKKIEEQKKETFEQVKLHIDKLFSDMQRHMSEYINQCYAELLNNMNSESAQTVENTIEKINAAKAERNNTTLESVELYGKLEQLIKDVENI